MTDAGGYFNISWRRTAGPAKPPGKTDMRQGLAFAIRAALIGAATLAGSAMPAAAETQTYGVFCASGKIEIDSRSEEQMRSQRSACQFSRFSFRMDAEGFARRNFGQIGARCSCK